LQRFTSVYFVVNIVVTMAKQRDGVTIYQRNGIWYARFAEGGKTVSRSLRREGVSSREGAERWARLKSAQLKSDLKLSGFKKLSPRVHDPFSEVVDTYHQSWCERRSGSDSRNERRFLDEILEAASDIGVLLCKEVDADTIDHFRMFLRDKGNSQASINRKLNTFRGLLSWMRKRRYLMMTGDDIADACAHGHVAVDTPNILNAEECNRLLTSAIALDEDYFTNRGRRVPCSVAVAFMLLGGLRKSEVGHLEKDHLYLDSFGKPIMVRIHGRKTNRIRHLPTHDSAILCRISEYVVSHDLRGVWTSPVSQSSWDRLREATEITATPNDLRKTCIAATASLSGLSEYLLEERFGHSHGVSVKHYRRPIYRKDAGETVESWLGIEKDVAAKYQEMCLRVLSEKIS
jgi:site-specific recombinase XerC